MQSCTTYPSSESISGMLQWKWWAHWSTVLALLKFVITATFLNGQPTEAPISQRCPDLISLAAHMTSWLFIPNIFLLKYLYRHWQRHQSTMVPCRQFLGARGSFYLIVQKLIDRTDFYSRWSALHFLTYKCIVDTVPVKFWSFTTRHWYQVYWRYFCKRVKSVGGTSETQKSGHRACRHQSNC